MAIAHSKLTTQGQVSVPADIRRKLGVGPGSILEWNVENEQVIVRRGGRYSSEEIHERLFPAKAPRRRTLGELKAGIQTHVLKRYARR